MESRRRRKQTKLYKQWVKYGDLPSQVISKERAPDGASEIRGRERNEGRDRREVSRERDTEKDRGISRRQVWPLFILLVLILYVIVAAVVIFVIQSY